MISETQPFYFCCIRQHTSYSTVPCISTWQECGFRNKALLSSTLGQEIISGFSFTHAYVWFQDADLCAWYFLDSTIPTLHNCVLERSHYDLIRIIHCHYANHVSTHVWPTTNTNQDDQPHIRQTHRNSYTSEMETNWKIEKRKTIGWIILFH